VGLHEAQVAYGASTCAGLVVEDASLAIKHSSGQSGYPVGCCASYGTGHKAKERNAAGLLSGVTGTEDTVQIAPKTST
jgi:hypothetical protein